MSTQSSNTLLDRIKDEVAVEFGYDDYHQLECLEIEQDERAIIQLSIITIVVERYAEEKAKEAQDLFQELCKLGYDPKLMMRFSNIKIEKDEDFKEVSHWDTTLSKNIHIGEKFEVETQPDMWIEVTEWVNTEWEKSGPVSPSKLISHIRKHFTITRNRK